MLYDPCSVCLKFQPVNSTVRETKNHVNFRNIPVRFTRAGVILFVATFLMAFGVRAQDSLVTFRYPNGIISSEGFFKNGKPDGYWKSYHENGTLKSEGNRRDGLLDSLWKFYNEQGKKTSDIHYRDGQKNGWQRDYFPTGGVSLERWMVNGRADSIANYYSEKGFLEKTVPLLNGVEDGLSREFAEDGRIITLITYRRGAFVKQEKINRVDKFGFKQGTWKTFHPNGVVQEDGTWKDDKRNGVFRWLSSEGLLLRMEIWKDGELAKDELTNIKLDIQRKYHNNGRPKSSVNLINGVREGAYREFDQQGKITLSRLYEKDQVIAEGGTIDPEGRQQGYWKYFYPDGKIRMEGEFINGGRAGLWKFYYPGGNVQQQGAYKANKPEGNWTWFYPAGRILREENYKGGKEEGRCVEYDESGAVIAEGNMLAGQREGLWKYRNGQYIAEGNYVEGLQDGIWKQPYADGKTAFEGAYFEGQENGTHRYFFPNGELREEQNFRLGLREGTWKVWDEEGELVLTSVYERGELKKMEGQKLK